MPEYVRRSCSECGIRLPQPEMREAEVQPIGVNGNFLASRVKWYCPSCAAKLPSNRKVRVVRGPTARMFELDNRSRLNSRKPTP